MFIKLVWSTGIRRPLDGMLVYQRLLFSILSGCLNLPVLIFTSWYVKAYHEGNGVVGIHSIAKNLLDN